MKLATLRAAILRELPLANKGGWVRYYTAHDIAKALDKVPAGEGLIMSQHTGLVERLRFYASKHDGPGNICRVPMSAINEAADTIEALSVNPLREALERIANGDEPRPIGETWREDGKPSKHDKCMHGRWMYEDCGNCIAEFASKALGEQP